jgi:hypothetical protein
LRWRAGQPDSLYDAVQSIGRWRSVRVDPRESGEVRHEDRSDRQPRILDFLANYLDLQEGENVA